MQATSYLLPSLTITMAQVVWGGESSVDSSAAARSSATAEWRKLALREIANTEEDVARKLQRRTHTPALRPCAGCSAAHGALAWRIAVYMVSAAEACRTRRATTTKNLRRSTSVKGDTTMEIMCETAQKGMRRTVGWGAQHACTQAGHLWSA